MDEALRSTDFSKPAIRGNGDGWIQDKPPGAETVIIPARPSTYSSPSTDLSSVFWARRVDTIHVLVRGQASLLEELAETNPVVAGEIIDRLCAYLEAGESELDALDAKYQHDFAGVSFELWHNKFTYRTLRLEMPILARDVVNELTRISLETFKKLRLAANIADMSPAGRKP